MRALSGRLRRGLTGALCAAALLGATSCTNAPPGITKTFWQLNLVRDSDSRDVHEALSLFVDVADDDGIKDIDSIYFLNDEQELFWRLDSGNWAKSEENGDLWVGSNEIVMNDRSPIPRGAYRVMVTSLSGERSVKTIEVSTKRIDAGRVAFPGALRESGAIRVTGPYREITLWFYNRSGDLLAAHSGPPGTIPLSAIGGGSTLLLAVRSFDVYAYDAAQGCGVISGPYDF